MLRMKDKIRQIKSLREMQKQNLYKIEDNSTIGVYNGLEMALAVIEEREPVFMQYIKGGEQEKEEQRGRTVVSGIKVRTRSSGDGVGI